MSHFVQQQHTVNAFASSDSWVILSPIEQSIKQKIEAVGVPLKDWDINIYRGVLTGCNEAFIINTDKRNEILANCKDEAERKRTEELIRPILRGRDIKRYGYVDSGCYLINTHNGIRGRIPRIKIEDYPAVKAHLDKYWDKISTRADQGDTPYNLRNCAYLEDFAQPRIVYREIGEAMDACMVPPNVMINNKLYMVSGKHLEHLLHFFNSKIFNKIIFAKANLTGGKGVDFMNIIRVPLPTECDLSKCKSQDVDNILYSFYGLSREEIVYIENGEA